MNTISPVKSRQNTMYVSKINKKYQDTNYTGSNLSFKANIKNFGNNKLIKFILAGMTAAASIFKSQDIADQKKPSQTEEQSKDTNAIADQKNPSSAKEESIDTKNNEKQQNPSQTASENDIQYIVDYYTKIKYVEPDSREYIISELKKYPYLFESVKDMKVDEILDVLHVNSKYPNLTAYYLKTGMKLDSEKLEQLEITRNNYPENVDKLISAPEPYAYDKIIAYAPEYNIYQKSIDKIESMIKSYKTIVIREKSILMNGVNDGTSDFLKISPMEILDVAKLHDKEPELVEKTLNKFNILNANFINTFKHYIDSPLTELILGRIHDDNLDTYNIGRFREDCNILIENADIISVLKPIIDYNVKKLPSLNDNKKSFRLMEIYAEDICTDEQILLIKKYRTIMKLLQYEEFKNQIRKYLPEINSQEGYQNIDYLIAQIILTKLHQEYNFTLTADMLAELIKTIRDKKVLDNPCYLPKTGLFEIENYPFITKSIYLDKAFEINPDMTRKLNETGNFHNSVIYCIVNENKTNPDIAQKLGEILTWKKGAAPCVSDVEYFISKYKENPKVTLDRYYKLNQYSAYTQDDVMKILKYYDINEILAKRLTKDKLSATQIERIFKHEKDSNIILKILDLIENKKLDNIFNNKSLLINIDYLPINKLIEKYKDVPDSVEKILQAYVHMTAWNISLDMRNIDDLIDYHSKQNNEDQEKIIKTILGHLCTNINYISAYKDLPNAPHHCLVYEKERKISIPNTTDREVNKRELEYVKTAIKLEPLIKPILDSSYTIIEKRNHLEYSIIRDHGDILLRTYERILKDGRTTSNLKELLLLATVYDKNPNIEVTDELIEEYRNNPYLSGN